MEDRTLIIKFYDKIQRNKALDEKFKNLNNLLNSLDHTDQSHSNNVKENTISVNYSGIDSSVDIISKDFIGYWKKIIYNLGGENQFGFNLEKFIEEIIKDGFKKEDNIFSKYRNDLNIKIIKEDPRFKKIYKSTLNINPNIPFSLVYLKCSWGGENTYAPLSVVAFLQYIVQNLSTSELKNFIDAIKLYPENGLEFYMKK